MAEPTSVPTSDRPVADENYRPLSGLAIAGFLAGILFAVLVLVNGVVAVVNGMPLTLAAWFYLFAIGGLALSLAGRWQIAHAEGTRAGLALTTWGLWLSVLFGLGYATYAITTHFAVRRQAEDFLTDPDKGFFSQLKRPGGVKAAFRLTRPADIRPADDETVESQFAGDLMKFEGHLLVRIIQQAGPEAQVEIQSISDATYKEGGYWVDLIVNVITPDEQIQYPMTVRSTQSSGSEREWYVDWTKVPAMPPAEMRMLGRQTEHGRMMAKERSKSHEFAGDWFGWVKDGELKKALKNTCNPKDFAPGGQAFDLKAVASEQGRRDIQALFDPDVEDRPEFDFHFTCCKSTVTGRNRQEQPLMPYYRFEDGRLQVIHEVQCIFRNKPGKEEMPMIKFACWLRVTVEKKKRAPGWCMAGLEVTRYQEAPKGAVGPPRGAMRPGGPFP
jgi:hypothetical protein